MNKFLKKIALFSAVVILILGIGEVAVRQIPNPYSLKNKELFERRDSITTLIIGSSHGYYGISPHQFDGQAFNLANVSQTPEYDLALLEKWVPQLPKLRTVILVVSYDTFVESKLEDSPDKSFCVNYKIYMHLPVHSDFSKYNLAITDNRGYFGRLRNFIQPLPINRCDSLGFGLGYSLAERYEKWADGGYERAIKHTCKDDERPDEVKEVYAKILQLLESRGIDAVFITTPTWHTYYDNLDPQQLAQMQRCIQDLQKGHNFLYLNYLTSNEFERDDFYDSDHLCAEGAQKLSRMVNDKLKELPDTIRDNSIHAISD